MASLAIDTDVHVRLKLCREMAGGVKPLSPNLQFLFQYSKVYYYILYSLSLTSGHLGYIAEIRSVALYWRLEGAFYNRSLSAATCCE